MRSFLKAWGIAVMALLYLDGVSQTQLEIHQINVGNGDGALIKLYDNDVLVYTIVIDGGLPSSATNTFIAYLKEYIPDIPGQVGKKEVNWVILSHNHQDHFNGLVSMFNDDAFIIREITDQGGYTIGNNDYTMPLKGATSNNCVPFITRNPKNKKKPQNALVTYVQAVAAANTRAVGFDGTAIIHYFPFDTTTKKFKIINLPTIGGVPVNLDCIATNGFTDGKAGRVVGGMNANNFTYGWILEYGQFRFYTGGDLGGNDNGTYTDQETPMTAYLKTNYPTAKSLTGADLSKDFPGHVCVMKADHHGSTESSNKVFLNGLACSAIVTSAGYHSAWKIPTVKFVDRVAAIPAFGAVRGVYFTQLYNYAGGSKALTEANNKFSNAAYDYIAPGATPATQYCYIFTVKPSTVYARMPAKPDTTIDIKTGSIFSVLKVQTSNLSNKTLQKVYLCHKP